MLIKMSILKQYKVGLFFTVHDLSEVVTDGIKIIFDEVVWPKREL